MEPPSLRKKGIITFVLPNPIAILTPKGNLHMSVCLNGLLFHFLLYWTFYKWNHSVHFSHYFFLLNNVFQRFIHIIAYSYNHLIDYCIIFHCTYICCYWWIYEVLSFLPLKTVLQWIVWVCIPLQISRSFSRMYTPKSISELVKMVVVVYTSPSSVSAFQLCVYSSTLDFIDSGHLRQYCQCEIVSHCDVICISLVFWWRCFKLQSVNRKLGFRETSRWGDDCHWRSVVSHSFHEEGAQHPWVATA